MTGTTSLPFKLDELSSPHILFHALPPPSTYPHQLRIGMVRARRIASDDNGEPSSDSEGEGRAIASWSVPKKRTVIEQAGEDMDVIIITTWMS